MNDNDAKSIGTGSWVLIIFLVVVALHVVAILGIAMFNGWKWENSASPAPKPAPAKEEISGIPEKGKVIENSTVLPVGTNPELAKPEKISSAEQSSLEKGLISKPDPDDEDEDAPAIPETVASAVKKEEQAKAEEKASAAEAASHKKTSIKPPAAAETAKTATNPDAKVVEAAENHASTAGAREKAPPAKTAAPPAAAGAAKKAVPPQDASATYTVQKGDTLFKIARQFNTTPDVLEKMNSIKDPSGLKAGTILKVPKK